MKKKIPEPEKQLIIERISSQLKSQKNIIFAYIFGSFVSEKKFSDIDIGIFVANEGNINSLNFELKMEKELQSLVHFPVDVRIVNNAPLSFVYHVIKEGILIKDEDPSERADFEGLIFKKYLDCAFFRKQYLKEVINAPI
ncbi:MAG: nucleotidyltransferase domain-containing protein [Candidatus Aminicenantes bacterium]|nr:nucleotidyltransferase domain-containing protein [Candidatus Aminicenantes bacterium]